MPSIHPRPPVLRPAELAERDALGPGTPVWAAVGLAVLLFVTLPAVFEHSRLSHELDILEADVLRAETELDQLRREATDEPTVRFLREKETRRIAHDGRLYLKRRDAQMRARLAARRGVATRASQKAAKK